MQATLNNDLWSLKRTGPAATRRGAATVFPPEFLAPGVTVDDVLEATPTTAVRRGGDAPEIDLSITPDPGATCEAWLIEAPARRAGLAAWHRRAGRDPVTAKGLPWASTDKSGCGAAMRGCRLLLCGRLPRSPACAITDGDRALTQL